LPSCDNHQTATLAHLHSLMKEKSNQSKDLADKF
jgi:hypothetical protein